MGYGKIALENYDDASLLTLADYYKDQSVAEIKKTLDLLGSIKLLEEIRKTTLDMETRTEILNYVNDEATKQNINIQDINQNNKFIDSILEKVNKKGYYDILKTINIEMK